MGGSPPRGRGSLLRGGSLRSEVRVSTHRWGSPLSGGGSPSGGDLCSEVEVSAQRWRSPLRGEGLRSVVGGLCSVVGVSSQRWESLLRGGGPFSLLEAVRSRVGRWGEGSPCGPDPHSTSPCAPTPALPPGSPKWFSHQWQELTRKKTELNWEPTVDRIRLLTERSRAPHRRNSALARTDTPA